jgi:hypothetical protein
MAQSNQPFKRPNLTESEEFQKIPPPTGQESTFVPPPKNNQAIPNPGAPPQPFVNNQPPPPTQEEINWALQLEESVQKKGYKPTDSEMAVYQDIANRIVLFQQAQAQAQRYVQTQPAAQVVTVKKKKNKLAFFAKLLTLAVLAFFFWAKISILVLQPSYFVPRGKVYFLIKPVNFSDMYYSVNMDKIYDEKLRKGFTKEDLDLEPDRTIKKKGKTKINPKWYLDPLYWEDNYILVMPYINFNLDF